MLGHSAPERASSPTGRSRNSGFDSLTAVELRNRLNAHTGLRCRRRWSSTTRRRPPSPATCATGWSPAGLPAGLRQVARLEEELGAAGRDEQLRTEVMTRLESALQRLRSRSAGRGRTR